MRKVISAKRVHDTLVARYVVCADAASRYRALVVDDSPMSELYRQMAATERCAAAEIAHAMTLFGFDDPRTPSQIAVEYERPAAPSPVSVNP